MASVVTLPEGHPHVLDWQSAMPAARQADHNLPPARTSFVGREQLLVEVRRLLTRASGNCRLLTLTGPGGTGKTRVALEAVAGVLEQFEDGARFVSLAPITDPRLVAATIAQTLGVREVGSRPPLESLKSSLRGRQLLLVLDNFEQVLAAAVELGELLEECPRLQILVTSRAALRLSGEREVVVPPLALPSPDTPLSSCESVQLFAERAQAVKSDFRLTPVNAAAVAEICQRLDGLPLAIELAAARTRLLDPASILARLEHRLQLLVGGARDLPARQQTLRNTIAWSYDLLDSAEQALFRRLAVFVGGCTLEAATAVCAVDLEVLDAAESLVVKSLVRPVVREPGETRLSMLETIREFGLEQLARTGELGAVRRRHAEYFSQLAERAEPGLAGPAVRGWLDRLETDHDNFRAALEWGLAEGGQTARETALRLAGALAGFWWTRSYWVEGRDRLERALAAAPVRSAARMKALHGAGWLAHFQQDSASARSFLQQSLAIAQELQDQWTIAWVLHALGRVAYFEHDAGIARALAQQSLAIAEAIGDRWLVGWALHLL
ncbi:MAG: AAA family ATPase, partial [Chloroflexi bacterium]|nr:AAA family ATPase [Chloroflexota bacterium]